MVSRETGRREFLLGAAGLGATGATPSGVGGSALDSVGDLATGQPALGVPGLDTSHAVRWTFEATEGSESSGSGRNAIVYPGTRAHGRLFTTTRTRDDGGSKYELVALDPRSGAVRWRTEIGGWSVPEVANGLVYVGSHGSLVALDPRTGESRWRVERESFDFRNVVVDGQSVFAVGGNRVVAIDATEGETRWTANVSTNDRLHRPLPAGERVYLGGERGFYALDRATGREKWFAEVPPEEAVTSAAVRDGLLVGWSDLAVYGLTVADGTRRWRTEAEGLHPFSSAGTVTDGAAYVWGENLTAIDVATGERRWTYDPDPGQGYGIRATGGRLFFPVDTGTFVALDAETGREEWRFDAEELHGYWGAVADGRVYVISRNGFHALEIASGRETWSLDLGDERALWADVLGDLAVVGTRGGKFYAVGRPSPLVTAPAATAERFATSPSGLGLLGLLGAGLLAAGYRRRKSDGAGPTTEADLAFGRLDRLGGDSVTETYRKRVRTPDGPRLVAETRLTDDAAADAELRRTFERAVEQWAGLAAASSGVLPVLDSGTDPTPWFETPFATGGSLADAWPVARRERVEVVSAVARTLHAAHREGAGHGRLAPRHVLLDAAGDGNTPRSSDRGVRVGGWFLADALADARDGRDPYQPPEGDRGGAELSAAIRADVYRVASLAHHLLCGEIPDALADGCSSASADCSDELADVLARALAADPEGRYDSLLEFDDAFRWAALDR